MPAFAMPPPPPPSPSAQVACAAPAPSDTAADDALDDDHLDFRTSYLSTRGGPGPGGAAGGYASGEAFSVPWDDGYGIATDTGFGIGWSGGLAYEARAGVGLGLRGGPLAAAVLVGGGLDGFGAWGPTAAGGASDRPAVGTGIATAAAAPLHVPFDAYTYIAGHLRYTMGELRLDVSAAQTSGTAADERRYSARLSYDKPFDHTGLGVDLERIELDDLHGGGRGDATMIGLSYSASLAPPPPPRAPR